MKHSKIRFSNRILATIAELPRLRKDEIELAIDGCAAVNFALASAQDALIRLRN